MSPIANPLVQGAVAGSAQANPSEQGSSADTTSDAGDAGSSRPRFPIGGFSLSANTSLHVGMIVLAALAVIVVLHITGFRFAVDAGVTRS